jgi:lipopolysaccharide/colanic/teichoic acid biosynthesis glycosyltransferase
MNSLHNLISARVYIISFFEAVLAVACYTAGVFISRPVDGAVYLEYEGGAVLVGFVAVTVLIVSYIFDSYKQPHIPSGFMLVLELAQMVGVILLVEAACAFIGPEFALPQPVLLIGSLLMIVVLVPWRVVVRPAIWSAFGAQEVLFVGYSPVVADLARAFANDPTRSMKVAGFVVTPGTDVTHGRVLGTFEDFAAVTADVTPDRIIVDSSMPYKPLIRELLDLSAAGVPVETASHVYESTFARIDCRGLDPHVVLFMDELKGRPGSVALQSVYTNILALVVTFLSLPVIALISVVLALTRRGPIFTSYECMGLHGIPFMLYRFHCPMTGSTWLTRLLLRYKVDALPQVANLVRGELALIGPRPERVEFHEVLRELIPFYGQKQSVKPGIFGWSQLHCDASPDEHSRLRLEYDLYYIKHVSVSLDLYIMMRGLKRVLSRDSAVSDMPMAAENQLS